MTVSTHNANGYKNGCRCDICRAAHRKAQRVTRKTAESPAESESGPLSLAQALAESGGPIEAALEQELEFLEADPPFRGTLVALARLNARVLDHVGELDRPDLLSSVQGRLMNALDRLAKETVTADKPQFDLAELLRPE